MSPQEPLALAAARAQTRRGLAGLRPEPVGSRGVAGPLCLTSSHVECRGGTVVGAQMCDSGAGSSESPILGGSCLVSCGRSLCSGKPSMGLLSEEGGRSSLATLQGAELRLGARCEGTTRWRLRSFAFAAPLGARLDSFGFPVNPQKMRTVHLDGVQN